MTGLPGFTADAALRPSRRVYRSRLAQADRHPDLVTPQVSWNNCRGDLCYFCDEDFDDQGCGCDWYLGDYWLVTTDCGSDYYQ